MNLPKVALGWSCLTFSLYSIEKNIYAVRLRLGSEESFLADLLVAFLAVSTFCLVVALRFSFVVAVIDLAALGILICKRVVLMKFPKKGAFK